MGPLSETLVLARDPQPGDAILSLPAICALAENYDSLWLAMANEEVRRIAAFPENVINVVTCEPQWQWREMGVQTLGVAASIGYAHSPSMMHPTQYLMAWASVSVPDNVPQPQLNVEDDDSEFECEILIAPWSPAEVRSLTVGETRTLYQTLAKAGRSVALLGGRSDYRIDGARSIYGDSYPNVVRKMRRAGCVVTVDSFPSRLAHAAGVKRHIILNSGATPKAWQGEPGASFVDGKPGQFDIATIIAQIDHVLSVAA